ncbi:DUF3427 domain-containing protein [Agrobacterium tumefaciens]|nr:DUF3427 domain-containing protein [Agrobacterium tumefaciens]NTE26880.1 DUF3427 domain-containing protein [Agrobacterium tumefaciens]
MNLGIYEQLITGVLKAKLDSLDRKSFYINTAPIDKEEASRILAQHLSSAMQQAFSLIKKDVTKQIEIANKIIVLLQQEIAQYDFKEDIIDAEATILRAVFTTIDNHYSDLDLRLKEITPQTRLTQSELFTGGNVGLSLESELKKEIASANRIDLLVSFIKWKAIVILKPAFEDFTANGGQLRVITTTYMGATDAKAIRALAKLPNTKIKVSYNVDKERLHAKAYLFYRNSGFHTGYIGSSNFSRSALTDGLEWNVKITTKEIPHIIAKFQKTFESYWQNAEFELYDDLLHYEKLSGAIKNNQIGKAEEGIINFFDIKPYHYQLEVLEKLQVERHIHGRFKNLIVAATGTGKTMISAFDFKRFRQENPQATFLFIAHRKEILTQARHTFRNILKDSSFAELWVDGLEITDKRHVFASVQTLNNQMEAMKVSPDYYDYIIIDEGHHATANSYRKALSYFTPQILLGLTATPERMDGESILPYFDNHIAAEIRLPEALNQKLLTPFQYFAIADSTDLSQVKWEKGRYVASELSKVYTANHRRVSEIIRNLEQYTKDFEDLIAIGFCVSKDHAIFMSERFNKAGLKSKALTSDTSSEERRLALMQLRTKQINYLFVVDILNEGIDIPEIDTLLFLRPTESLTIFLQQLGRGLRLHDGKDVLTVLDFVGNANVEYDFEGKFRALIGKTSTTVQKEIENDFPHLPLGCAIVLEKQAKETILANIKRAINLSRKNLIYKIKSYAQHTDLPLTLANFLHIYNLDINLIYARNSWSKLCDEADVIAEYNPLNEKLYTAMLKNKWLSTSSHSYFSFLLNLAKANFVIKDKKWSEAEELMLMMLHYDFWQKATDRSLIESIEEVGKNRTYVAEIISFLTYRLAQTDFEEYDLTNLSYAQPLKLHARYTRDQVLAAFRLSTLASQSSNREGVAENKDLNTELLFIDLTKSEEDFSPTTLYDDYAINEILFHWQSQNQTRSDSGKGLTYINHQKLGKKILLFVREAKSNQYGNTQGYVFIGEANFIKYEGSKPMSITWELQEPIPNYLWKDSAKLVSG